MTYCWGRKSVRSWLLIFPPQRDVFKFRYCLFKIVALTQSCLNSWSYVSQLCSSIVWNYCEIPRVSSLREKMGYIVNPSNSRKAHHHHQASPETQEPLTASHLDSLWLCGTLDNCCFPSLAASGPDIKRQTGTKVTWWGWRQMNKVSDEQMDKGGVSEEERSHVVCPGIEERGRGSGYDNIQAVGVEPTVCMH